MKIEYRVRPVTRYVVTRYHETDDGRTGGCETRGEFDSEAVAHDVAYALCKAEHDTLGYPPGDERVQYPKRAHMASATTGALLGALASGQHVPLKVMDQGYLQNGGPSIANRG